MSGFVMAAPLRFKNQSPKVLGSLGSSLSWQQIDKLAGMCDQPASPKLLSPQWTRLLLPVHVSVSPHIEQPVPSACNHARGFLTMPAFSLIIFSCSANSG
ncbi:unnamed protein product, partial [Pleuronectes platessa]